MKTIAVTLIRIYQLTISPLLGNNCRFIPSCSCYAKEAISKHGICYGSYLSIKRIMRCNPWNNNFGVDDPP